MHILFNGCSYTWGDELDHRERDRFSTLVSNHYNASHSNISDCGVSNDAIARTTMEWFAEGNKCDLAIIQWTVISRIEGYNQKEHQYEHITTQTPKMWKRFYSYYYHHQLGVDTLFKNYYLLEQYFIKNNIKYFFLFHDCWENIIFDTDSVWKELIVRKDFYCMRGNLHHNNTVLSIEKNHFTEGNAHPNELGHQVIANYIIDHNHNQ